MPRRTTAWGSRRWVLLLAVAVSTVVGAGVLAACWPSIGAVDTRPGSSAPEPAVTRNAACTGGDDTTALTEMLATLAPGDTLLIPAGMVCRHSRTLVIATPRVRLSGAGTLLATNEASSSIRLDADGIVLDGGLTIAATGVTQRWGTGEQMGVLLAPGRSGIVLRDITIDGSAAAGVLVAGAGDFTIDRVSVRGSRADGIALTNGSHDGTVRDVSVSGAGDDGVAVVSYRDNEQICHDLEIINPTVTAGRGGRGLSVVGGRKISFRNIRVESASAASVYIAQSSRDPAQPASWDTSSVDGVTIDGGTLLDSNSSTAVGNGAVVVGSAGPAGYGVSDVLIKNLTLRGTRSTAPSEVGIYSFGGGSIDRVSMQNFAISDGPDKNFATNIPTGYSLTGWTVDGVQVPPRGN